MAKYFDKFPLVSYSNNVVKNIIARVDFMTQTQNDINSKFDFVLTDGLSRPDLISHSYYNSPWYDWVVYLNNKIVDPYHDYYLSEDDIKKMIITKYGSVEAAQARILHYRNNWAIDDGVIDVDIYNGLNGNIKKYYKPNINLNNQIISYSRLQEDWTKTTNKTLELTLDPVYLAYYSVDDIITQTSTNAKATVKKIIPEQNILIVQHVFGSFSTSDAITNINDGPIERYLDSDGVYKNKKLWQIIDDEEASFWEPVNAYDYEMEQNVLKRYISIIKADYIADIDKILQIQMAE